ncbi:hypothetical protein HFK83_23190 [Ralstonia pseudosolanacearum]|uniref:DUF3226 domain-containing protein n=1 Tax=Ralstonia pseudosolanacearum TaxID=1310165 RepID=UPI00036B2B70|nr:DUF3226 domain-containing protein [Ralstonia pseudosolanacearum]MCK4125262.1 hypothetical protein [Ralstonia pseudosolanacearum]
MKAVFVFCEGNHDVTFIVRSLGQVLTATWVGDPIGKLPSPLGPVHDAANPTKPKLESFIAKRYSTRTLNDLRLQAAAHAPPPAFEAIVKSDDTLYVLIRCHGDGAAQAAIDLLADVNAMLNPAFGTDIKEIAAAFVFDADESLSQRELTFVAEYAALLSGLTPLTHGKWVKGAHPVGLYVFHDQTTKKGTLEEILAPLVASEWSARWNGAGVYLNSNAQVADPVSKKRSELLKAQINVTGQFLFPGDPMSVVIGRPKGAAPGLPDKHFIGTESQSLVQFLQGVPW